MQVVDYFVTKGCDQILTMPLCNPLMSLKIIPFDSSMGSVWTCQALNWPWTVQLYKWWLLKPISMLAHTMVASFPSYLFFLFQKRQPGNKATTVGCPESTAVELYTRQNSNGTRDNNIWIYVGTIPLRIFHFTACTNSGLLSSTVLVIIKLMVMQPHH